VGGGGDDQEDRQLPEGRGKSDDGVARHAADACHRVEGWRHVLDGPSLLCVSARPRNDWTEPWTSSDHRGPHLSDDADRGGEQLRAGS